MQLSQIDILAAGAAIIAIWLCGVTRVQTQLWGLVLQTALLATIALFLGISAGSQGENYLKLAGIVLLIKAIFIPIFLAWAARRLKIPQDVSALLNPTTSLLVGLAVLGVGYFLAPQFAVTAMGNSGAAGMALTLLIIGMLLMITRRLALSQLIGFLVLENGIFLYGLTQTHGMPMLLEMGVVFEVLVGVLIAGFVIFRLNRSFEHIDVTDLRGLRH